MKKINFEDYYISTFANFSKITDSHLFPTRKADFETRYYKKIKVQKVNTSAFDHNISDFDDIIKDGDKITSFVKITKDNVIFYDVIEDLVTYYLCKDRDGEITSEHWLENDEVIRKSSYWFKIGKCFWTLDNEIRVYSDEVFYGKCKLQYF